jgi:hypothetical protein
MVRAFVLYDGDVDEARYAQHLEIARAVPGATFRHGKVFGSPFGEPKFRHYAEFEWPDMDAFKSAARSDEFAASGRDASEMGVPFTVHFAEIAE